MNVPAELETLRDWLRYAVSRFNQAGLAFGHGTANAYDEAVYLLLHALHLPLDHLEPFLDARLSASERNEVAALLTRRIDDRVPAAYLTHEAWLGDFRFHVDERVIIPRSYIAELLADGLSPYVADRTTIKSALDLCTGSGCLAVLLAHAFGDADVDAVDISADALAVAQRNVSDYGLAGRINLIRSDLFDNVPAKSYDLIISNPPYVTAVAMEELPAEYRHEPVLALAGGDDGLDAVRTILRKAPQFMNRDGLLIVEIGQGRDAAEAAFPRMPFVWLSTPSSEDAVFLLSRDEIVNGR
ncbi:MAG TPA: 50S ribosomal protein L3 N(5)-glutamine methyltransferase [Casimicrobiaceae bacterium]|nr:50S ribosomal protein L3 N(5)-glutamine methyltransferase [Casimicrobiaceae bacterium]